jgi:hypothetical protein
MANEITTKSSAEDDGFNDYTIEHEGAEEQTSSGGAIQGELVKFDNQGQWVTRTGDPIDTATEFVAVAIGRFVVKWGANGPIETVPLQPGEKYPDLGSMNEQTPKSEWREGFDGQLRGPWAGQQVVYLLHPGTLDKLSWPSQTSTIGSAICVRDLIEKVKWMRRFRGQQVYAVIKLASEHMATRYGGRQRPRLAIQRWVTFGSGASIVALPTPELPTSTSAQLEQFASNKPTPAPPLRTIVPPTLAEEADDEIPF